MRPSDAEPKAKKGTRNEESARKRRALVEQAMREKGWDEEIIADLKKKTRASRATLYRDRDVILGVLASEEAAALPERRALFLLGLRRLQAGAARAGAWAPAVKAAGMEAQLLGLDRVPLPEVEPETAAAVDTSLEAVLAETRRMRRQAQAGHSYVAAGKLLEQERTLAEAIRARDKAIADANLEHQSPEEILTTIVTAVRELPDSLRERLRKALE